MLVRSGRNWLLDGRPLRNGDLVEIRLSVANGGDWVPGVVTCDGSAVVCQGTAAPDPGHHAADARLNLTLQRIMTDGVGLRHAWRPA